MIKSLCVTVVALLVFAITSVAQSRTIYIVRHAEKAEGTDPALSDMGVLRSLSLYKSLKEAGIQKVYTSRYRRTQGTAEPFRAAGVDTVHYTADGTGNGFKEVYDLKDTAVLVVAHSNTIPGIIRSLGVAENVPELPETQYDDLFIVHVKDGQAQFTARKQ